MKLHGGLRVPFEAHNLKNFDEVPFVFSFVTSSFVILSNCIAQGQRFTPVFFYIVLAVTFRSMILKS